MTRALWILAAYLRASVRMFAVRLVRMTLYRAEFVDDVERWILDGIPMRTIEQCVRARVGTAQHRPRLIKFAINR